MSNRSFERTIHDTIHFIAVASFAIGLPSNKIILSMATTLMLANLLIEGQFRLYWERLLRLKFIIPLIVFWLMHVAGLLWTSNFNFAISDLKNKITLLIIPVMLLVKPLDSTKKTHTILVLFICTLLVTSLWNILSYNHLIGNRTYLDVRELSLFGSHIRYGILIALGVGFCLYLIQELPKKYLIFIIPSIIWFGFYTYFSQVVSGLLALLTVIISFVLFKMYKRSKITAFSGLIIFTVVCVYVLNFFMCSQSNTSHRYSIAHLKNKTVQGNKYSHNLDPRTFENGKPSMLYVCEIELKREWNKRSILNYDKLDRKGQPLKQTLMRYMASKDLKKDSADFQKLSAFDIKQIENGVTTVQETEIGFPARLEGIKYALNHNRDPNGNSLLQRLEYWKTGLKIISNNWLLGVGTGDVQDAFNAQYVKDDSPLKAMYRLRAHNSYLTAWISFGIIGLLSFLLMIGGFMVKALKSVSYPAFMFILTIAVTCFLEDTLETQMGVSMFALFYGLLGNMLTEQNALSVNTFESTFKKKRG